MHEIPASLLARAMKHATERDRLARVLVIRWQLATGVRLGDSARETLVAMIVTRMSHQYHLGERFAQKIDAAETTDPPFFDRRKLSSDIRRMCADKPAEPPLVRLGPGGDYVRDYTPETSHA